MWTDTQTDGHSEYNVNPTSQYSTQILNYLTSFFPAQDGDVTMTIVQLIFDTNGWVIYNAILFACIFIIHQNLMHIKFEAKKMLSFFQCGKFQHEAHQEKLSHTNT